MVIFQKVLLYMVSSEVPKAQLKPTLSKGIWEMEFKKAHSLS